MHNFTLGYCCSIGIMYPGCFNFNYDYSTINPLSFPECDHIVANFFLDIIVFTILALKLRHGLYCQLIIKQYPHSQTKFIFTVINTYVNQQLNNHLGQSMRFVQAVIIENVLIILRFQICLK